MGRCIKHDIDYMHGRLYSEFQLVARSVSNPAKSHSAPGLLGHHGRRLTVELLAAIRTEFDEPNQHVRQAGRQTRKGVQYKGYSSVAILLSAEKKGERLAKKMSALGQND